MTATDSSEPRRAGALGELRARAVPITFTYVLNFLENLLELAYPWAIGAAVNGLIAGEERMMWPLVAIWVAHVGVGATRQVYDTRLFSRLNARMSLEAVRDQRRDGVSVSQVSARVEMIEELIEFLEVHTPVLLAVLVSLVGSLAFLVHYDLGSGLVMIGVVLPILALNAMTGLRAYRNNVALNSEWEKQVQVISDARPRRWRVHFGRMAQWRIRLSDLDALSWSFTQLFILVAVVFVLYRAATAQDALAGDVFAVLAYALRVEQGMEHVPSATQQVGRLVDIRRRIRGGD